METVDRSAGIAINAGLGAVFVVGLAATAYLLIDSWGGAYWLFNGVVGMVVSTLALLRQRWRAGTAIAGVAVATVALVVSLVVDLPQEPGPVTASALSVLVGSTIRTLAVPLAGAITAGGLGWYWPLGCPGPTRLRCSPPRVGLRLWRPGWRCVPRTGAGVPRP